MATAKIIFQQNGDGYLIPTSRDDLVLGLPVTMLNQDNTGVVSWAWVMVDRPNGSSASIVSPTASTTTFTPDVVGTYLIHLSINAGAAQDQRGAAVKTANLHYRIAAATETTEFDGYRGWATATNAALKLLDDGYKPPTVITFQSVYNSSNPSSLFVNSTNGGLQIHDAPTPIGSNIFEVDAYSSTKYFQVSGTATTVLGNLLQTGGIVGLGTNTPGAGYTNLLPDLSVHIYKSGHNMVLIDTGSTPAVDSGLVMYTAALANDAAIFLDASDSQKLKIALGAVDSDAARNTNTVVTIQQNGAVGLGTSSPSAKLHVVGTGHFTGSVALDGGFTAGALSSMGGFRLASLGTPTVGTDGANKAYVDAAIGGSAATLQSAYTVSTPATIQLNSTSGAIIFQDSPTHFGAGLDGGHTPLFKIDAYNSASNYMQVYRAGEELNRDVGQTVAQTTGASVGVVYNAMWGSGATDIYAVGSDSSVNKQQIAHFNGTSWTTLTSYPGAVGDQVNTIYGFGVNAVYIGTQASLGGPGGIWFTSNSGTSWTQQYNTKGINAIWGADATHIYAGVQDNSGIILSSNGGGTWSPVAGSLGTRFIHAIWGASANEFWVASSDSIWHTTNGGLSFTNQFDTNVSSAGFIAVGFSVNWKSIWGTSASNVYAVGSSLGTGYIAHYNGTFWTLQVQNYPDSLGLAFNNVYGTTVNDVYVSGGQTLLYSNGTGAWIPQRLSNNLLAGGVNLNAVWAPVYNQWYIATGNTNPVAVIALAPQGGNMTAPGIARFGALVTNNITTPDIGLNAGQPLTLTAFIDSDNTQVGPAFLFNTTQPVYTLPPANFLASFQSGGVDQFKIKGDGYFYVPSRGGFKQLNGADIFGWIPGQILAASSLQVNNTLTATGLGTFQSHVNIDGYTIDISGGAVTNQALIYNGSAFVPSNISAEKANAFDTQLTTTSATTIINFTPTANRNHVVYVYYRVANATTNVTIVLNWTDNAGSQNMTILPTTSTAVGSYSVSPVYIQATTAGAITVVVTAGTANNIFISSTIIAV